MANNKGFEEYFESLESQGIDLEDQNVSPAEWEKMQEESKDDELYTDPNNEELTGDDWKQMIAYAANPSKKYAPDLNLDPTKFPMQLKYGADNVEYRADFQSGWEQAWRSIWTGAVSGGLTFAEDIGYLGELLGGSPTIGDQDNSEDIFNGMYTADNNALSQWARDNKEKLRESYPIYTKEIGSMDFSDPGFRWTLFRDILDSVIGFGGAGASVAGSMGKLGRLASGAARLNGGLRRASKVNKLARWMTNPTTSQTRMGTSISSGMLTNYAEGKMIAYDSYENTMNSLKPYIERGEISFKEAATMAGDRANSIQLFNSAIMFTDMYAISKAIKGIGFTRDIVNKPSFLRSAGEVLGRQGLIEAGEEYYQGILSKEMEYSTLAEYEQKRREVEPGYEMSELRDTPENFGRRLQQHMTNPQVLLEALMGYFGGAGQYGAMSIVGGPSRKTKAERYEEQQAQIVTNKEYLNKNIAEIDDLDAAISKALSMGNKKVAEQLQDIQMYNILVNSLSKGVVAGQNGDAKGLINMAEDIMKSEEASTEEKAQAEKLISKAKEMEADWLSSTAYYNQFEVFLNVQVDKMYQSHIAGLEEDKSKLMEEFDSRASHKAGDVDFGTSWESLKDPKKISNEDQKKIARDMAKTTQAAKIKKIEESIAHYKKAHQKNLDKFDEMTSPKGQKKAKGALEKKIAEDKAKNKRKSAKKRKQSITNLKKSLKKAVGRDDEKEGKDEKGKKKKGKDKKKQKKVKDTFFEDHGNDLPNDLIAVAVSNDIPLDEMEKYVNELLEEYEGSEELFGEVKPMIDFINSADKELLATDAGYADMISQLANGEQLDQMKLNFTTEMNKRGGIDPADTPAFAAHFLDLIKKNERIKAAFDDKLSKGFSDYLESIFNSIIAEDASNKVALVQSKVLEENADKVDEIIRNEVAKGTSVLNILQKIQNDIFKGEDLEKPINDALVNTIKEAVRKMNIKGLPSPMFTDYDQEHVDEELSEEDQDMSNRGLADASSSIAYNARAYQSQGNFLSLMFSEISNQLNEGTDPKLMSPVHIQEGAKVKGEVDHNYNGEVFYQVPGDLKDLPEFKDLPNHVSWQVLRDAFTALQNSGDERLVKRGIAEYTDNVPIKLNITDNQGKPVESYMHSVPWIQPNRVAGETQEEKMQNAREQRLELRRFRQDLLASEDQSFNSEVDFVGTGRLFIDKDGIKRPYSENIPDSSIDLFTMYRGNLVKDKSNTDQTSGIKIENRKRAKQEGRTYALMTMGDGSQRLFPISHQILSEDMIDSIMKAIDVYSKVVNDQELDPAEEDFVKHVRDMMKGVKVGNSKDAFNIKTTSGIENYIRLFTYTHNLFSETQKSTIDEGESLEEWLNSLEEAGVPALRVETNGIDFGTSDQGKVTKAFDWVGKHKGYMDKLRAHLEKTYTHVNLDLRGQDVQVPIISKGELTFFEEESYDAYMKRNILSTNIMTPAVTINGKTEFLHTIQRVVGLARDEQADTMLSKERLDPDTGKPLDPTESKKVTNKDVQDLGGLWDGEMDFEESGDELTNDEQILLDAMDREVVKGLSATKQDILIDNLAANKAEKIITGKMSMVRAMQELLIQVQDFLPESLQGEASKIVDLVREKITFDFDLDSRTKNRNAEDYDMNSQYDKSDESIFDDPRLKMSKLIKMLFYGIINPDSQAFGQFHEIVNSQRAYYDLMSIGHNARSIKELRKIITDKETLKHYPYMAEIDARIKDMSGQNKKRLMVQMQKQPVSMKYLYFSMNSKGELSLRIADDNSSDYINYKQQLWKNLLHAGFVANVNPDTGDIIADYEAAQALINEFDGWVEQIEDERGTPTPEQVKSWLDKIGIEMHLKALEDIERDGLRVAGRANTRIKWEAMFTKKFSQGSGAAFALINNDLKEITKHAEDEVDKTLDFYKVYKMGRQYRSLALANKPYDAIISPHTYISGGKRISGFAETTFLSEQMRKLIDGDFSRYEGLAFSEGSMWLEMLDSNEEMKEKFDMFPVSKDPRRKQGAKRDPLEKLNPESHNELMWGYYQNEGKNMKNFSSMTFSNKKNMWMIQALAQEFSHEADGSVTDDAIELLYQYVAMAELSRMNSFDAAKDYNNKDFQKGANVFHFFPSMNGISELFDGDFLVSDWEKFKPEIIKAIRSDMEGVISTTVESWIESGVVAVDQDTKAHSMAVIDKEHKKKLLSRMEGSDNNALVQAAASDFEINYLLARANMFQTIYGDIANYHQQRDTTDKSISATFQNLEKRLAGEVAPGALAESSEDDVYNVLVVADSVVKSRSLNYYKGLVEDGILTEEDIKAYEEIEESDAGEFTSVAEHLNILHKFGKIDTDRKKLLQSRSDRKALTFEDIGFLMKVVKPVQVGVIKEGDVERKVYIKSASYPLIPQVVAGTQLEELVKLMEDKKNPIQRIAPESAVKLGAPKLAQIFDEEGNMTSNVDIKDSILRMQRSDFRIQQETPEKDPLIKRFSQASKLAFMNYMHLEGLKVRGSDKDRSATELFDEFIENISNSAKASRDKLFSRIKTDGAFDLRKVARILSSGAEALGYSKHEIEAFTVLNESEEFLTPLWSLSGSKRFEQIVNSVVNREVVNDKMPGFGHKLVSEEGWVGEGGNMENQGVVFTNEWVGHLRSIQEEDGLKTYDIILPWTFEGSDMQDFIGDDGKIDMSKIDEDILTMFGIRIPTQSHKSMAAVRVVGFLPRGSDVAIGNRDLVPKTGWDFDYDAFYTYHYNTYTDKKGKLQIFDENTYGDLIEDKEAIKKIYRRLKDKFDEFEEAGGDLSVNDEMNLAENLTAGELQVLKDRLSDDEMDPEDEATVRNIISNITPMSPEQKLIRNEMSKLTMMLDGKAHYQNKIIDIHLALMNNQEVSDNQTKALESSKLEDLAVFVANKMGIGSPVHISSTAQSEAYTKASGAKDMVSIAARMNVFYAMMQTANVDMNYFMLTEDEDGFITPKNIQIDFARRKGNPKVNAVRTYEDNSSNEYRSEILSRVLSASVDDANEQILRRINLNSTTSPIFKGMFYQGYADELIVYMLNQPITIFVTKEAQKFIQAGSSPQAALDLAIERANELYQSEEEEFQVKTYANNISRSRLESAIGKKLGSMSRTVLNDQLRVLKTMKAFINLANEISPAEEAANMDSNTSSSLVESIERQRVVEETIPNNIQVTNIMDFIGEFSSEFIDEEGFEPVTKLSIPDLANMSDEEKKKLGITEDMEKERLVGFKPKGIAGVVYQQGILLNNEMWLSTNQEDRPTYFYRIPAVAKAIGKINEISKNTAKSPAAISRQSELATRALISYIMTDLSTQGSTAHSVRQKLVASKDAVARKIRELKKDDPDNPLLLQIAFNTKKDVYDIPFLINTGGNRTLELHLANQLKRLTRTNPELMADLLRMEMAIGTTTNYFNNIWRLVSPQIMRHLGIGEAAYNYDFAKIGETTIQVDDETFPVFIEQFYQTYTYEAVPIMKGHVAVHSTGEVIETDEDLTSVISSIVAGEDVTFAVDPTNNAYAYKGEPSSSLPYLRIDGGKSFGQILLKLVSSTKDELEGGQAIERLYKPIQVMGEVFRGGVFREFEPGSKARESIVNKNSIVNSSNGVVPVTENTPTNNKLESETAEEYNERLTSALMGERDTVTNSEALHNMMNSSFGQEGNHEILTLISKAILENQSGTMGGIVFGIEGEYADSKRTGAKPLGLFSDVDSKISLFSDTLHAHAVNGGPKTPFSTLVHESVHGYTSYIFSANPADLSQREIEFKKSIERLYKSALSNLSQEERDAVKDIKENGSKSKLPGDQKRTYYPFVSEKEFIAGLFSSPTFVNRINGMTHMGADRSRPKSLLREILDSIINLLNLNQDSIAYQVLTELYTFTKTADGGANDAFFYQGNKLIMADGESVNDTIMRYERDGMPGPTPVSVNTRTLTPFAEKEGLDTFVLDEGFESVSDILIENVKDAEGVHTEMIPESEMLDRANVYIYFKEGAVDPATFRDRNDHSNGKLEQKKNAAGSIMYYTPEFQSIVKRLAEDDTKQAFVVLIDTPAKMAAELKSKLAALENKGRKIIMVSSEELGHVGPNAIDNIQEAMNSVFLSEQSAAFDQKVEPINVTSKTKFKDLSNFAYRSFQYNGDFYATVEQAFQAAKADYADMSTEELVDYNKGILERLMQSSNPAEQKHLGKRFKLTPEGLAAWEEDKYEWMQELVKHSFFQNDDHARILVNTGQAELIHKLNTADEWTKDFPAILMETRRLLQSGDQASKGLESPTDRKQSPPSHKRLPPAPFELDFEESGDEQEQKEYLREGVSENPILTNLNKALGDVNESIASLKQQRESTDSINKKKRLAKTINNKRNDKARIEKSIREVEDNASSAVLITQGQASLAAIKDYVLTADVKTEQDHVEMTKMADNWSDVSTIYENTWENPQESVIRELAYIEREIKSLEADLDDIALRKILERVQDTLGREYTMEDITKVDTDESGLTRELLDITMTGSPIASTADKIVDTARRRANEYFKDVRDNIEDLDDAKEIALAGMGLTEGQVFRQRDKDGHITGQFITPYSQTFYDEKDKLFSVTQTAETAAERREAWKEYHKFLEKNTSFIDIESLISEEGISSGNEEEIIKELAETHGEIYARRLVRNQISMLKDYHVDLEMESEELAALIPNQEDREMAIDIWKIQNSPYYFAHSKDKFLSPSALQKLGAEQEMVERYNLGMGLIMDGDRYLYEMPNITNKKGELTKWANKDFRIILNNEDLMNFHAYTSEKFEQMRGMSPIGARKRLEKGAIPFFSQQMKQQLLELSSISRKGKQITDEFVKIARDDMKGHGKDLFDPEENRRINASYVVTEQTQIADELQRLTVDFIMKNGRNPTQQEEAGLKDDAADIISSINMPAIKDILVAHAMNASVYYFKNSSQDILVMLENAANGVIDLSRSQGSDQRVIAKNTSAMLSNMLDTFFMVKNEKGQAFGDKIYTYGEEQLKDEWENELTDINRHLKLIQEAQVKIEDDLENDEITAEEFEAQKNKLRLQKDPVNKRKSQVKDSLERLGGQKTDQGMIESIAHAYHIKTLGWKLSSGIFNLIYGITSNFTWSGGGQFFSQGQLGAAYKLTFGSIMKNFGAHSENGIKIANVMYNMDVLKEMHIDVEEVREKQQGGFWRRIINPYEILSSTEYLNQAPIAVAVLMNHTVTHVDTGEEIQMWDAINNDGSWNEDYEKPDQEQMDLIKTKIDTAIRYIHGNYDAMRKIGLQKGLVGRLASMFRRWIPNGFATRFKSQWTNHQLGMEFKGRYLSYGAGATLLGGSLFGSIFGAPVGLLGAGLGLLSGRYSNKNRFIEGEEMGALKELLFISKQLVKKVMLQGTDFDSKYRTVDAQNLRANLNEIMIILAMMVLKFGFGALKDLLEDNKGAAAMNRFMANAAERAQKEIAFFLDPQTFMQISQDALPLLRMLEDIMGLTTAVARTAMGDGTIETGAYAKQNRAWRATKKNFPVLNNIHVLETMTKTELGKN